MMLRNTIYSSLSVALISLSSFSWAGGEGRFYAGGEVSQTNLDLEQERQFFDENETGYGFFAGFYVTPNIAFELGYKDFGNYEEKFLSGETLEADLEVTTLAMKLDLPISYGWGVNMSLGYGDYSSDLLVLTPTTGVEEIDEDRINMDAEGYFAGLGVSYDLMAGLTMGLSYEYHVFEEDDEDLREEIKATLNKVSLNALYRF